MRLLRLLSPVKPVIALSLLTVLPLLAQDSRQLEYAVLLDQPAVAAKFRGAERAGFAAQSLRLQVRAQQTLVKSRLRGLGFPVTGSSDTLVNAIYVTASREQAMQLGSLPGVLGVALTTPLRRKMDRALANQNVTQAWNSVGGASQAGTGVKIAIIDSGIDQTHPALTDPGMKAPAGFPVGDANFTTGKVIAARSYISSLTSAAPKLSSPDDFSPRDRVGHGTALAAIAAGVAVKAPIASISGVAPKAWLGNYKIFGTPGIHDTTSTSILVQALEDAYTDGMDIAVLAVGTQPFTAPFYGPLDTSTACTQAQLRSYIPATACDINAYAVEHAVQAGMLVVVAAGNDGCSGLTCPTLGTIASPGTAPAALTVGSTTNSRVIYSQVKVNGEVWKGLAGNGPKFTAPLTAPLVDLLTVSSDATMCSGAPAGSLTGKIVLLARGTCAFFQKVTSAQNAGAIAVLMYDTGTDSILPPSYLLTETGIPIEYVGNTAGLAIRAAVKANPGLVITIDPAHVSADVGSDVIAFDSSRGPATGTHGLKPEIAAVGAGVYTATQKYDPNGDVFDVSGYASVDGTSYAAAMVAGAAALVKQAHPGYTPAQLKSALVNTASNGVVTDADVGGLARVTAVGAGKLNAGAAVSSSVTASPSAVSFGVIGAALPSGTAVSLTNTGAASVTLSFAVARRDTDANATVTVSPASLTLAAGQSQTVTVALNGRVPAAGTYEGQINVTGTSGNFHIPYLYLVSDRRAANAFPIIGDNYFAAVTEYPVLIAFRVIDQYGAPVANVPTSWTPTTLVDFDFADRATDVYGIAAAYVSESRTDGIQSFEGYISAAIGWEFYHFVNFQPFISKGIFNAATQQSGNLAPGSYATISGTDFSSVPIIPTTGYLPISLGMVSVTFDAPGVSAVAPISYVSPTLINVQIPWEMQGQTSATVKVRYHDLAGPTAILPLATASPAFFEYTDATNSALSVVAQDLNYALITSQNAAGRGKVITLYANGLGPVDNTPATGQQSSATLLGRTTTQPQVTIGGKTAQILFSGLTPQTIGLYQINVQVPADAATGLQSLTLSIGGVTAKSSQIVVQ